MERPRTHDAARIGTTRPVRLSNCRRVPENRHARDRPTGERPGAARQALAPGAWLRPSA